MRRFFTFITAGVFIAAIAEIPFYADGSYYFFRSIDRWRAITPHNRYINFLLEQGAVYIYRFVHNMDLARLFFATSYAVIPLLALLATWFIVRDIAPKLFVWAALGTLALTSTQFIMQFEAQFVIFLFFPVLMIVITEASGRKTLLAGIFLLAMMIAHPFSVPLLLIAAGIVFIKMTISPNRQIQRRLPLIAILLLAAGISAYILIFTAPYSPGDVSGDEIVARIRDTLLGLPLLTLLCAAASGVFLLIKPQAPRVIVICASVAAFVLIIWSALPQLWANIDESRVLSIIFCMPFVIGAVVDSFLQNPIYWSLRLRVIQIAGLTFLAVMLIQGSYWAGLVSNLRSVLAQSPKACISSQPFVNTVIDEWSITTYSLVLQDLAPRKIVMRNEDCLQNFTDGFTFSGFLREWRRGRMDFSKLRMNLLAESLAILIAARQ